MRGANARARMPSRRLLLWSLASFAILALLAAVRVADWSYGADTGTFVQVVLGALGPMYDGVEHTTHYRFHWSPTLVVLWPLLAATHSVWVLQAVLALATVACAPLLAAIARTAGRSASLDGGLADRIGAVVLVYPPLVAVGFGEFRELGLLPPLALGWWLARQRRAWGWLAACAVLLAGLREDVCLELAILGIALGVVALQQGDRPKAAASFATAALATISAAIYVLIVLPRVGPWPPSHFYDYPFAHGPLALLTAPFVHPIAFAAAILTFGRLTYVLEALVPLALVPLRSPQIWLSVPGFAIVLLANSGLVWRMGEHYAALWIPWLLIAFAAGIATLRRPQRWTTIAFVLSAVVLIAFSPLHPGHYLKPSYHSLADARAALACVPAGATVATHDEWYTAVSAERPGAMVLGDTPPDAEWLVVADDYPNSSFASVVLPRVHALAANGTYREVCRRGAVTAYARSNHGDRALHAARIQRHRHG
jgi:uncharacterized membrane protein